MFCIFLDVRCSNYKLMHFGYQYVALNFDPRNLKCLVSVDAYHISSDEGLGIFAFDKKADIEKHINVLKEFFKDYEDRFSWKTNI